MPLSGLRSNRTADAAPTKRRTKEPPQAAATALEVELQAQMKQASKRQEQNMRHPVFPRGPPPQYYPGSTVLNLVLTSLFGWEAVTHGIWPPNEGLVPGYFF